MKTSLRRKLASRANGTRSKGPKTPEGKRRSSYNALRHGWLADNIVLPAEDRSQFEALINQFVDRFEPLDDTEFGFIEEMAVCYWRMRRAWAAETELLADAMDRRPPNETRDVARLVGAFAELADAPTLPLINRYETRLQRMYQRALRSLLELRKARLAKTQPEADSKEDIAPKQPENANFQTNQPSPISGHPGICLSAASRPPRHAGTVSRIADRT